MEKESIRPWGEYSVIGKTKIISVKPNQELSLQYHNHRDEFWKIISGTGKVTIGKKEFKAKEGNTFSIPRKINHRIKASKIGIKFLEIATGEIDENDIVRLKDSYGRVK